MEAPMILDLSRKISLLSMLFLINKLVAKEDELISPGNQKSASTEIIEELSPEELKLVKAKLAALPKTTRSQMVALFNQHKNLFLGAGATACAAGGLFGAMFLKRTPKVSNPSADNIPLTASILASSRSDEVTPSLVPMTPEAASHSSAKTSADRESRIRGNLEKFETTCQERARLSKILLEKEVARLKKEQKEEIKKFNDLLATVKTRKASNPSPAPENLNPGNNIPTPLNGITGALIVYTSAEKTLPGTIDPAMVPLPRSSSDHAERDRINAAVKRLLKKVTQKSSARARAENEAYQACREKAEKIRQSRADNRAARLASTDGLEGGLGILNLYPPTMTPADEAFKKIIIGELEKYKQSNKSQLSVETLFTNVDSSVQAYLSNFNLRRSEISEIQKLIRTRTTTMVSLDRRQQLPFCEQSISAILDRCFKATKTALPYTSGRGTPSSVGGSEFPRSGRATPVSEHGTPSLPTVPVFPKAHPQIATAPVSRPGSPSLSGQSMIQDAVKKGPETPITRQRPPTPSSPLANATLEYVEAIARFRQAESRFKIIGEALENGADLPEEGITKLKEDLKLAKELCEALYKEAEEKQIVLEAVKEAEKLTRSTPTAAQGTPLLEDGLLFPETSAPQAGGTPASIPGTPQPQPTGQEGKTAGATRSRGSSGIGAKLMQLLRIGSTPAVATATPKTTPGTPTDTPNPSRATVSFGPMEGINPNTTGTTDSSRTTKTVQKSARRRVNANTIHSAFLAPTLPPTSFGKQR